MAENAAVLQQGSSAAPSYEHQEPGTAQSRAGLHPEVSRRRAAGLALRISVLFPCPSAQQEAQALRLSNRGWSKSTKPGKSSAPPMSFASARQSGDSPRKKLFCEMLRPPCTLPTRHRHQREQPFEPAAGVALPAREPAPAHTPGGGSVGTKASPVSI